MLPLQQAYEVRESIMEFIRTTYRFKEADVQNAFYNFLADPEHGLMKGPYVSLKAPFVSAPDGFRIPLEIAPSFPPYKHQIEAFEKLTTEEDHRPHNTLVTTGTGSGKTECFLYPILDYCYKHIGEKGIKVMILYPMNALATDQAKRLAQSIYNDPRLQGKITAGLFIGKGLDKKEFSQEMTQEGIIEDSKFIVANPPDILLTNFKMLDYGIMKGENATLWSHNIENPGLLKYVVLDELHTYDGAQGTDVANLLRRLKLRVGIDRGQLCCVGTSATIGSGEESKKLLCDYASDIFGEGFNTDDVIEEHRVRSKDLFIGEADTYLPSQKALEKLSMKEDERHHDYLKRQMQLWSIYDDEKEDKDLEITETLSSYQIVRDLFAVCEETGIVLVDNLIERLSIRNTAFGLLSLKYRKEIIESLLALIAEAKIRSGSIKIPFLPLQVQLWIRELSGIRRYVDSSPRFTWKSDMKTGESDDVALAMYYCRECGASGWISTKQEASMQNKFDTDASKAVRNFMTRETNVWLMNTAAPSHKPEEDEGFEIIETRVKKATLHMSDHLPDDDSQTDIIACRKSEVSRSNKKRLTTHHCPECSTSSEDLSIVGSRAATLSSLSVSQLLCSNLDSASDRERKTLTFTNGVQDAAHLSGFYTSREYRFTMRASIQRVIEILTKEGADITLQSIYDRFVDYWKKECVTPQAYLYRFFPNDYVAEINLKKDFLNSDGTYKLYFLDEFDLRIFWEIVSEFGLMTSFGRSLERTGSAASYFKVSDFDAAYDIMKPWMDEYMMMEVSKEQFEHFLTGFLERSILHGAISHPYLTRFRETLKTYDLNWYYGKEHFLNRRFGRYEVYPQPLITINTDKAVGDHTYAKKSGWYLSYFKRCFNPSLTTADLSNDFYIKLAEVLTTIGIFDVVNSHVAPNYCINPAKLYVSTKVQVHQCDHCQSTIVTSDEFTIAAGTPCIVKNCPGSFAIKQEVGKDYYQRVYKRENTPRIYSHEHTGLLGRKEREEVEYDFKNRPNTDSYNALVATSTLEMGIDIGDLNSELNVGIPPLTSNYLQRVGRAGRKSGGALILDFAKGDPHDLFFFEDPMAMMKGAVNTPGCYLNAKDILRRHFFAFCLDSWTSQDPGTNHIPHMVGALKPSTDFLSSPDFFVNKLFVYIKENLDVLASDFSRHYSEETYKNVLLPLFDQFRDDSFEKQVRIVFQRMHLEYASLTSRIADIAKEIKSRNLSKTDPEFKILIQQKDMTKRQRKAIGNRILLEFMTDEGLLPNYAFPETGVKLSASILGTVPRGEAEGKKAEIIEHELVRPASAGLKDLAPGNHFYYNGLKLTVNGINTADWKEGYTMTVKRFCSRCDCIEDDSPTLPSTCPKCGDPSFGSDDHKHVFIDLRDVKANQLKRDAVLDDHTDERERVIYRGSTHFRFDPGSSAKSYGMKDIPFGIEYITSATLFEANLGEASAQSAFSTEINRQKVPVHGFVTCKHCGKSVHNPAMMMVKPQDEQLEAFHYPFCKHKNKLYKDVADDIFEQVFLSRQIHTEAIKVLIPVHEIDSDATLAMFKAGMSLGLRSYFRGNPQHIAMKEYQEFNMSTGKFDNYIVLYDTIPGGTGYLAKLFDTVEFSRVLKMAWERLDLCKCQYDGMDGCYHCVLSYENKYVRNQLSRAKAAELFKKIVDRSGNWETISGSIGTVTQGGGIEESELETRFITSLRETCKEKGWEFTTEVGFASNYYKIKVRNNTGELREFTIMPQVTLGQFDGVEFQTRPDFYIECKRREKDGSVLPVDDIPHIALFLDGYAYHGSSQHGKVRFYDDFKKRESVHRSGRIISWTMSWEDISHMKDGAEDSMYIPKAERLPVFWNRSDNAWKDCQNDYQRFLHVLTNIDGKRFRKENLIYLLSWTTGQKYADWEDTLAFKSAPHLASPGADGIYSLCLASQSAVWADTRVAILPDNTVKYSISLSDVGQDLDKDTWNHFWRLYNMLNLSKEDLYTPDETVVLNVDEILENFDEVLHDFVRILIDKRIDFETDGGFALYDSDQVVLCEAQLGVESLKVVVDPYEEQSSERFVKEGYRVLSPDQIDEFRKMIGE